MSSGAVLPIPGMILRASMLSKPYRAWGVLDEDIGTGTATAGTVVTQFTSPNEQIYSDRKYRIDYQQVIRCLSADNTLDVDIEVDPGSGTFSFLTTARVTTTVGEPTLGTDTVKLTGIWTPGVDSAAGRFRVRTQRILGAGTIDTGTTYYWTFEDVGAA